MSQLLENNFYVTGVAGPILGREFVILSSEVRLGRTPDNDIMLNEGNVSRHHASFWVQNGQLWIQDMQSKNGVFVNDEKVSTLALKHNDIVRIGISQLRVGVEKPKTLGFSLPTDKFKFAVELAPQIQHAVAKIGKKRIALYGGAAVVFLLFIASGKKSPLVSIASQTDTSSKAFAFTLPTRPAKTASNEEVLSWLGRAEQAMRYDDVTAALPLLQDVASARPDDARVRALMVRAQARLSQLIQKYYESGVREYEKLYYDRAIDEWQKVLALSQGFDTETYVRTEEKIKEVRQKLALKR